MAVLLNFENMSVINAAVPINELYDMRSAVTSQKNAVFLDLLLFYIFFQL